MGSALLRQSSGKVRSSDERHLSPGQVRFMVEWTRPPFVNMAETARRAGLSAATPTRWTCDIPWFRDELKTRRDTAQRQILTEARAQYIGAVPDLVDEQIRLALEANSEQVRRLAISDALDRALGPANPSNSSQNGPATPFHALDLSTVSTLQIDVLVARLSGQVENMSNSRNEVLEKPSIIEQIEDSEA